MFHNQLPFILIPYSKVDEYILIIFNLKSYAIYFKKSITFIDTHLQHHCSLSHLQKQIASTQESVSQLQGAHLNQRGKMTKGSIMPH